MFSEDTLALGDTVHGMPVVLAFLQCSFPVPYCLLPRGKDKVPGSSWWAPVVLGGEIPIRRTIPGYHICVLRPPIGILTTHSPPRPGCLLPSPPLPLGKINGFPCWSGGNYLQPSDSFPSEELLEGQGRPFEHSLHGTLCINPSHSSPTELSPLHVS